MFMESKQKDRLTISFQELSFLQIRRWVLIQIENDELASNLVVRHVIHVW